MMQRSFKPAKCKTSVKLAASRIKLMKNKRGVQMNQMKNDLAQLIQSGQDRTARIRVEHLIREEKTVAAYDLLEIYCELIVARLPIIESQKTCPIDLKEAITSVVFAAPRCADIPELLDIKKHFTAKYGKEFITAALELRPDCGVARMLVEKLSAVAPDGQTKVKVLGAIAKEHNIKWDSQLFEEKVSEPADDLLNGPSTLGKASVTRAETPKVQVQNVQATASHENHANPLNFNDTNLRSSEDKQNRSSAGPGSMNSTTAATHPDLRSSGSGFERMEVRNSFSKFESFSSGGDNWNMEFKDATSAAQAAAESAERASMAARAAAELSSRDSIYRQYSTESQKSNHNIRHERPEDYAAVNNSFNNKNSKLWNEQLGGDVQHNLAGSGKRFYGNVHGTTERSKTSDSRRSSIGSTVDDGFANRIQMGKPYSTDIDNDDRRSVDSRPKYDGESSSDSDSDTNLVGQTNNSRTVRNAESPKKFDIGESTVSHPFPRSGKSQLGTTDSSNKSYLSIPVDERSIYQSSRLTSVHRDEDNFHSTESPDEMEEDRLFDKSSSESESKLNFGALTGGLRHKGYQHPSFNKNPTGDAPSFPNKVTESSSRVSSNSSTRNSAEKSSSFNRSVITSDSDSDSDNSAFQVKKNNSSRQAPYAQKSKFGPPVGTYFDHDNDDSEEDMPKQALPEKVHSSSFTSRRTKASLSETSSYSPASPNSSNAGKGLRTQKVTGTSTSLKFQARHSPDPEANGSFENPKTAPLKAEAPPLKAEVPTREDSGKRASHVHPKLPDYDSIAAQFQSLRTNRR